MGSWSISPCFYTIILVPLRHLHTNAKPKFITAIDCCFNPRHRSSKSVSTRKTLITAPPTLMQRLITACAKLGKQRLSSVLRWPSGLKRPRNSSSANIWLGFVRAVMNFVRTENCPFLCARKYFCSSMHSEREKNSGVQAYTAFPSRWPTSVNR